MNIKIALFALALLLNSPAWSAEKKPAPSAEQATSETVKPKVKPQSDAEKLYHRYQRLYGKMILAIVCVQNPKCIQPEDEVIKYNIAIIRVTDRLDDLVKQKDLDASYYRGLIAYERGKYYVGRATLITDPDFILSATVFRRYALDQLFLQYLRPKAKAKYIGISISCHNEEETEVLQSLLIYRNTYCKMTPM